MDLLNVELDDRYDLEQSRFYLNGTQSLIRLIMLERRRRIAAKRNTAVFISGYRGSPLGGFDQALVAARSLLGEHVVFQPGVNEDLAATAIWGTQQVGVFGEGRYDGVSALWYGKGPGVDRTGDVFKHGNLAGSAREGGVLVVAGDDHTCKSSTTAHQSEFGLIDAMIPVLAPASVAEQIEYGLVGWELSRFSGLWAGMKVVTEIMDSSVSLSSDPIMRLVTPSESGFPRDGLSLRWPDTPLAQEERLHRYKLPAALAFSRANRLDRVVFDAPKATLGVVTVGKSHADTLQALRDLGAGDQDAGRLRLYKVAMPWPLEPEGVREFARGLTEIVVVEEKRGLVEDQFRQILYGQANAPRIVGKHDDVGGWLFPSNGELGADLIAIGLGQRIADHTGDAAVAHRAQQIAEARSRATSSPKLAERPPFFCSGCPHNRSTKPPEGSRAFAGIGCHYLVLPMQRDTEGFTHMGGEGANWIGLAPFSVTPHMFQNIGDGTYFHSGSMAIRAAVAAGVNITYKVLFNGAVAMTGGQPMDGELDPRRIAEQVLSEGAARVAVVADDPSRYGPQDLPTGVGLYGREDLDSVQRELRDVPGVTVLIYDQVCATELRRRRKRGTVADPGVTVMINDLVCEGCGDCSAKSNCVSIVPLDTEYGRKRAIDQASCNKDRSCVEGFCPSFVSIAGARPRRSSTAPQTQDLPEPTLPDLGAPYPIVVTGVGGTGVVTVSAIIGMAAHMEGKAVLVTDMTGLAQKGGAVVSHIQIGKEGELLSPKISGGAARLLIGCDAVVAAMPDHLAKLSPNDARIVASDHPTPTGQFTIDTSYALPMEALRERLAETVGSDRLFLFDATELATRLVGDAIGANMLLLGYAWQGGFVPLSREALDAAIVLNGAAVALNKAAFDWGRRLAVDPVAVRQQADQSRGRVPEHHQLSTDLEEVITRRTAFLTDYQNAAYAARYEAVVRRVQAREQASTPGESRLTDVVARTLFQLMAYKDEYEVARLHTASGFVERLREQFDGPMRLTFHMAPPLLSRPDPHTGEPRKMKFGPWILPVLRLLTALKGLRGTPFDPFGWSEERRAERRLIDDYLRLIEADVLPALTFANHTAAVRLAEVAQDIRGYGHVKAARIVSAEARSKALLQAYRATVAAPLVGQPA